MKKSQPRIDVHPLLDSPRQTILVTSLQAKSPSKLMH
jgi:hypothetical protein